MSTLQQNAKTTQANILAPRSHELEFGGVYGALFVTVTVPLTLYYLTFACSDGMGCALSLPITNGEALWEYSRKQFIASFLDSTAWKLYYAWYFYCIVAWFCIDGAWVEGLPLRTGERLKYKLNALKTGALACGWVLGMILFKGAASFTILYEHFPGMLSAALVNSIIQAVYVYWASFHGNKLLALAGNSGNVLYDWFIGRELNPRIGQFDIKTFNELRPGLVLWALIDVSCACYQYTKLGYVTDSMMLVTLFHVWYIFDSLINESTILTQMDITTDGFGFMLSVGDLAWVPFIYSLQARFLAFHPVRLGLLRSLIIMGVQLTGFYIFRVANSEKNEFRQGRNPKNLQFMTTKSGRKLLTSGWWGMSRHPNYFGDWIMAWAWCLPCGFSTPIPYFYVLFFAILLVHRQLRDDEACRKKYGSEYVLLTPKGTCALLTHRHCVSARACFPCSPRNSHTQLGRICTYSLENPRDY